MKEICDTGLILLSCSAVKYISILLLLLIYSGVQKVEVELRLFYIYIQYMLHVI